MNRCIVFLSALFFALPTCKKETPQAPEPGAGSTPQTPVEATPEENVEENAPEDTLTPPEPGAGDTSIFSQASNALAMDLYRVNRDKPGNLVFSPASISMAFAMTYAGAAGTSAEEMRNVLHFPEGSAIHDAAGSLLKTWNTDASAYQLKLVNRLFGEGSYSFEKPFLTQVESSYHAALETLDFKTAPDAQREHINSWVAEQTENRINDLLPAPSINSDTRLVLVNAIYFLGSWATPFVVESTADLPFLVKGKKRVPVPTMSQVEYHRFGEVDGARLLELAYKDSPLAMTLVLPNKADGLPALEKALNSETLQEWLTALSPEKVSVHLPRFELKDARLPLVDSLKALGMKLVFSRGDADFRTMANPPAKADRLFISAAFHEAFVKVDESGTEAAAATAVVMARAGGAPTPPKEFHADHPFLFLIRDTESGAILFLGRVVDPS